MSNMKNTGKALVATALLGTTAGCVVLGVLYNSVVNNTAAYAPELEKAKAALKDLEDKLGTKEVELNKAKEELTKLQSAEVDLAPCEFTEHSIDYKTRYEEEAAKNLALTEQLEDTQAKLNNKDDDLTQELIKEKQEGHRKTQEVNNWKAKFTEKNREVENLKVELEKERAKSKAEQQQMLGMMGDMGNQYLKDKELWETAKANLEETIADLKSQITGTVNYWLNKTDGCDYHYSSYSNRYGKSCDAGIDGIEREMWFAGEANTRTGEILKAQYDKAPTTNKYSS